MIELRHINKTYHINNTAFQALTDVNLCVNPGEIFGVIGKSGAGKSTLIRCVNLLERPTSGSVWVNGQDLTKLSPKALRAARHKISMVFQHFNLFNARTVFQNVAFPLELLGKKKQDIQKIVMPLLTLTGLEHKAHVYPSQLSGGQKQRVAIARALATRPTVLLCDEMTSSLDPETTESILKLIKTINSEMNLSVLLITHEMDVIKSIADNVAVLDHGKLIEQNDVLSIFKDPKTDMVKRLTQATVKAELPHLLQNKLQSNPIDQAYTILRINFIGKAASEAVINRLIRDYQLEINILQARLEFLRKDTIGSMLVASSSDQEAIQRGVQFLHQAGLSVEVMGYVSADDWFYH